MPTVESTLFPPLVNTKMPAFVNNTTCKVYFSLSPYNNISNILNCQVSLVYQNNNKTALKKSSYQSQIKLCSIQIDSSIDTDYKYYIEISPSDLEANVFDITQFYKVQLRFTSIGADTPPQSGAIDNWLAENIEHFSEWSSICLLKAISQPTATIDNHESVLSTSTDNYITVDFDGKITFANTNDNEFLLYFKVLTQKNHQLINDSGIIYPDSVNKILYSTNFKIQPSTTYSATFEFTTNNGYVFSSIQSINVTPTETGTAGASLMQIGDQENGRIKVVIEANTNTVLSGNYIIRRSSIKDDFNYWDDIFSFFVLDENVTKYEWFDYSIESGVLYKYAIQKIVNGVRTQATAAQSPILLYFNHMYLTIDGQQLNIKLDPNISSYQYNLSETFSNTIGSQYPLFRRNGSMYYRTFTISGTINSFMDQDNLMHASKEDIFKEHIQWYNAYNQTNRITEYNDFIYQKEFREKVINFLYANNVKLFRSGQEGNILVKISGISFSPNTTLGRRVYSFSCTAYEIDKFTLENCVKYNIISKKG